MKMYGEADVYTHVFLTLALVGEWSASRPGRFTPSIHSIGGGVGPRASLDDTEKGTFLTPPGLEIRSLDRPARSQTPYPTELSRLFIPQTSKEI
jgi:hypothetical protein